MGCFVSTANIHASDDVHDFRNLTSNFNNLKVVRNYFLSFCFSRFVISVMSYKKINSQNQSECSNQ